MREQSISALRKLSRVHESVDSFLVLDAEGTYEMKKKKKKGITGWFKGAEKKKEGKKIELDREVDEKWKREKENKIKRDGKLTSVAYASV